MQKRNMSPTDAGCLRKNSMSDIAVPKYWWDIAWDLIIWRNLNNYLQALDVNKLPEGSYKLAYDILSVAMKGFEVSKAALHTVSIRIFQVLLSCTNNQARRWPISCQSALHWTDLCCCALLICFYLSGSMKQSLPKVSNKDDLFLHTLVLFFGLREQSKTELDWSN